MEKKPVKKRDFGQKKVRIAMENDSLDYFLQTYEELNHNKVASAHRTGNKLSGRGKDNNRVEK